MTEELNPFAGDNLTAQMRAIRSNPETAKQLIAAAGKVPADFGWSGEPFVPPKSIAELPMNEERL